MTERVEMIQVGNSAGVRVSAVNGSRVTLGRALDNDVVVSNKTVSRHHAVLERVGTTWRLRDLHSRNGTRVNGVSLRSGSAAISNGDRIELGSAEIRMTVESQDGGGIATVLPTHPGEVGAGLTPRETEVLRRLAEGMTDEQIAESLFLSVKTVRSHLDRIRDKSGVRRRPELTRFALREGLIDPGALL